MGTDYSRTPHSRVLTSHFLTVNSITLETEFVLTNTLLRSSLFTKDPNFSACSLKTDKGKLPVRAGRKAVGHLNGDCQVSEVFNTVLQIFPITNQISLNGCLNQSGSYPPTFASPFGLLPGRTERRIKVTKGIREVSYEKNKMCNTT